MWEVWRYAISVLSQQQRQSVLASVALLRSEQDIVFATCQSAFAETKHVAVYSADELLGLS